MVNGGGTPAGGRRQRGLGLGWVAVLVVVVVGGGAAVLAALSRGIHGSEVGPDAHEMSNDPVLHIEVGDAVPGEIYASTGREGGIAAGLANGMSRADRQWTLESADWQNVLLEAVEDVDAYGVTWWALSCSQSHVTFRGLTDVVVGGEVMTATVEVAARDIDGTEPGLQVSLYSSGGDSQPPSVPDERVDVDCGPWAAAAFASL